MSSGEDKSVLGHCVVGVMGRINRILPVIEDDLREELLVEATVRR